ncbi:MAG: hypothetical protein RSA22_05610 [Acinetobacter sp.]
MNNDSLYWNKEKSQDLVRQSQLQKQNNVSSGVVHKGSASSKGSKYPTLPHLLGQLETAHVGVAGTRTSSQSLLSPNNVVNFFEQNNQPLYSRNADYNAIADRIANGVKNNHFCA